MKKPVYVLNDENSHEPLYDEMTTEEKEAMQAKQPPGPPVVLPFGTKISVPGLPPGSRVNPGGITPMQRAFDKKLAASIEEQNVDEEAELSAERTLAENPNADVVVTPEGEVESKEEAAAEGNLNANGNGNANAECADCDNALDKIDEMAGEMEEKLDNLEAVNTNAAANDDGYAAENVAANDNDDGYGDAGAEAATNAAADEGYGEEAATNAAAADEGYGEAAAAAPADEGYGEETANAAAADEGYGEATANAAAADEGYGETAAANADEGYGGEENPGNTDNAETAVPETDTGLLATTDNSEASRRTEGSAPAGDVPLETGFLEIFSSFTPENLLKRINDVDAPLPQLLRD